MREIKFRAWDIEAEEYLPISDGKCDGVIGISADGVWVLWLEDGEITRFKNGRSSILEQYTGLKDKNGKEIYEGDIVLVANQGRTPYVVIYREGDCSFVCNNEFIVDYVHLFKGMPQCYEVIGNIHENPELLDVKKEG